MAFLNRGESVIALAGYGTAMAIAGLPRIADAIATQAAPEVEGMQVADLSLNVAVAIAIVTTLALVAMVVARRELRHG